LVQGAVFGSPKVHGLYELLFAEAWPVSLNPGRFRSDEARMQVLARTAGILGELEAAIRRELGGHGVSWARSRFYEHEEAAALYDAVTGQWRTLIELGMQVGLRPGEMYGLHGHRVDWLRGRLEVVDVMTRKGLRQWPKSKKSHRVVPVPPHVLEDMSVLMAGRRRDSIVFTAPEGGPVTDAHFRNRVWYTAIMAAGIRRFPPRIMRHTAASWLVQDGVPLYDVQALLGHEDYATTQRSAIKLAPDAHGKVLESWERRLDARVTHELKEAPHR
jgi:integrase